MNTFRQERIGLVLSNTPKGNIYSALAAWVLGIPTVPNVSGLGRAFIKPSAITHLVRWLYRLTFRRSPWVFFQNQDDRDFFLREKLVKPQQAIQIPGSGVDLTRFQPVSSVAHFGESDFTFLLLARLLWDKGIGEYVEAASQLRKRYPTVRFQLLGQMDVANPAAIPRETVQSWQAKNLIEYLGMTDEVRPFLQSADCVVLPSYREGTPRSLLEAAAVAKPVITADAVGCRNVVDDGVTGFLCELKSASDLAEKMEQMLKMPKSERLVMGQGGRQKMEREFDEQIVIRRYLEVVEKLSNK